jgi:hypothetical protein
LLPPLTRKLHVLPVVCVSHIATFCLVVLLRYCNDLDLSTASYGLSYKGLRSRGARKVWSVLGSSPL